MKTDLILAGVGGQGVLSAAGILAEAARRQGLEVHQGELHGMSQRGGAVQASLRLADRPIQGDLVPRGAAAMLLSLEPLESLRYLEWLAPDGVLLTASEPFENIPDYPPLDEIHERICAVPGSHLVDAARLAREAGSAHAANVVLVGAATWWLPLEPDGVLEVVLEAFQRRGERVVEANRKAFLAGRDALAGQAPAAAEAGS